MARTGEQLLDAAKIMRDLDTTLSETKVTLRKSRSQEQFTRITAFKLLKRLTRSQAFW